MNQVDYKKLLWGSSFVAIMVILIFVKYNDIKLGVNIDTLSIIGTIGGVNWFLWELFKRWFWKLSIFRGWLVKIPNLNGEWVGTLQSTWKDPSTRKVISPIIIDANIKQDLTSVAVDITSNEMVSQSIVAVVKCNSERDVVEICYTYQSEPGATVRHRSEIHFGTAKLSYKNSRGKETLEGNYWTDRKTTGDISLKRKS